MENKKFDFNEPIEKTATGLAKLILDRINESKEDLIYEMVNRTEEMEKATQEKSLDFATGIVQAIAATDLPADYISYPIEKLIATLSALKVYLEGTMRQTQDEYLSRSYGVKHPETGKFRKELITVGGIMMKLDEVRKVTGDKPEEYFNN